MAQSILNNPNQDVFIVHPYALWVYSGTVIPETLIHDLLLAFYLEKESTCQITAIKKNHMEGGQVVIGYKLLSTLYCPFNKFNAVENNVLEKLDAFIAQSKTFNNYGISSSDINEYLTPQIRLYYGVPPPALQLAESGIYYPKHSPNERGAMYLELKRRCSIHYDIEQLSDRFRLVISINGTYKSITNDTTGVKIFN
ncbi:MAG: hypothetical protein M9949_04590 [Candidatus Kapabacteria bacterium]|nr:hypothetical protein [Candidatus Kapabacteria bacterium]